MHIRKAVLPVAGLGTRVLPASKVVPKELLPIVDKPTLQYIVEEAVAAGIEEIIFVTSRSKRAIEDHFDAFPELEQTLERKGKQKELEELRRIQKLAKYAAVRQVEPLGLGHAVLCARELVGNEPFVVMLGDEIYPEKPCLQPIIEAYQQCHSSVLTLVTVPHEQVSSYGIASAKAQFYPDVNLSALIGVQSVTLSKLLEAGSAVPSFGAAIRLPIMDGGKLVGIVTIGDVVKAQRDHFQGEVDTLQTIVMEQGH